ncbi:MAG: hypothetical protein IIB23_00325 [Chloroflexi bacterium]|nr:hypothetical protein [Chloroflexota bacterium]MCH8064321.1 hypothetical protein [Chloroflexota bacterium]
MDSDFRIDIGEVQRAIDVGEITALYFPLLRKTLLMDTRTTGVDGPMIKVVPMASSPEERFRDLVRMRPRLPKPESINIVPWPKYVASLVRLQVWDHIVRRFLEIGPPEIVKRCEECLEELKRMEREEIRRAITGENYETLWDVAGTQEGAEVDDDDEELV